MLVAVAVAALAGGLSLARRGGSGKTAEPRVTAAAGKPTTLLVMTVQPGDLSTQADTLALFSIGGAAKPYIMLIPSGTLTDIPGYGFDLIGRALSFGRIPLAEVSVENMLGVRVDHTAVIDQDVLGSLVDKMGGIEVSVKQNLFAPDGQGRLVPVFAAGTQKLDAKKVGKYLRYQGPQETELSRLERQQQVWEGIFARFEGSHAAGLAKLIKSLGDKIDGDGEAGDAAALLASFSGLPAQARAYDDLPVSQAGGGEAQAFKISESDLEDEVQRFLNASRTWTTGPRPRLQLLNGNGVPEAGVSVAEKLVPAGFHLVDTGNSRSFDFAKTKIVVYSDDAAMLRIAEQVRTLIGRGEIEVQRRAQTSVDVTVVIGKDLLNA